jgi:hypothetical protein
MAMTRVEYEIFREAVGNRPLSADKVQVGFKYFENEEITDSPSFSIPELERHIEVLEAEGQDASIFREALKEAKGS